MGISIVAWWTTIHFYSSVYFDPFPAIGVTIFAVVASGLALFHGWLKKFSRRRDAPQMAEFEGSPE